jgi:hypothetical protein
VHKGRGKKGGIRGLEVKGKKRKQSKIWIAEGKKFMNPCFKYKLL